MHRTDVLYRPKYMFVHLDAHSLSHLPKFISSLSTCLCTHTHLLSTFEAYHEKYHEGAHDTVYDFARAVTAGRNVDAMIDVYCEAPVRKAWKELADSALTEESRKEKWGGMDYWFVMGEQENIPSGWWQ